MDEVGPDRFRQTFSEHIATATRQPAFAQCGFVIAGREWALREAAFDRVFWQKRVEIQPLGSDEIDRYVHEYFRWRRQPEIGSELCRHIQTAPLGVRALLSRPYVLRHMCEVHRNSTEVNQVRLPNTATEVMQRAVLDLLDRRHMADQRSALLALGATACAAMKRSGSRWADSGGQAGLSYLRRDFAVDAIAAAIQKFGGPAAFAGERLLTEGAEAVLHELAHSSSILLPADSLHYCFVQIRIAEYLAGHYLAALPDKEIIEFVQRHAFLPKWLTTLEWMARTLWNHEEEQKRLLARRLTQWVLTHIERRCDDFACSLLSLAHSFVIAASDLNLQDSSDPLVRCYLQLCPHIPDSTQLASMPAVIRLPALSRLVDLLEDRHLGHSAAHVLQEQPHLPDLIVARLVDLLCNTDTTLSAASALEGHWRLRESSLHRLVDHLSNPIASQGAARVLCRQSHVSESIVCRLERILYSDRPLIAILAINWQSQQSVSILSRLVELLGDPSAGKWVGATVGQHSVLPDSLLIRSVSLLGDPIAAGSAAELLISQSQLPESDGIRLHLPESILQLLVELLDKPQAASGAMSVFLFQHVLPETISSRLVQLLNDPTAADNAAWVLSRKVTLSRSIRLGIIGLLDDSRVASYAAEALGLPFFRSVFKYLGELLSIQRLDLVAPLARWARANLPEPDRFRLRGLLSVLEGSCSPFRRLRDAPQYIAEILMHLVELLPDPEVGHIVPEVFCNGLPITGAVMSRLAAMLHDRQASSRVLHALRWQTELPESIVSVLFTLLDRPEVAQEAIDVLGAQSALSESTALGLVDWLPDHKVGDAVADTLIRHSPLLGSVIARLEEVLNDTSAGMKAAKVLGMQSQLPESALLRLVDMLRKSRGIWVQRALDRVPHLPVRILRELCEIGHERLAFEQAEPYRTIFEVPSAKIAERRFPSGDATFVEGRDGKDYVIVSRRNAWLDRRLLPSPDAELFEFADKPQLTPQELAAELNDCVEELEPLRIKKLITKDVELRNQIDADVELKIRGFLKMSGVGGAPRHAAAAILELHLDEPNVDQKTWSEIHALIAPYYRRNNMPVPELRTFEKNIQRFVKNARLNSVPRRLLRRAGFWHRSKS